MLLLGIGFYRPQRSWASRRGGMLRTPHASKETIATVCHLSNSLGALYPGLR